MQRDDQTNLFSIAEELAGVGHWKINLVSQDLFWSEQVYRIHELDPAAFTPTVESAIEFYHPDDRVRVSAFVADAIAKGEDFEFDLRLITANGNLRYVRSRARCAKDDTGTVIEIFGIFLDITQLEEERQRNEVAQKAHQTHIEASGDGYWDWYIQEDYEYMSPRFWEMFGYEPHEKPHKPASWQAIIFKEDLERSEENFRQHVSSRGQFPYEQQARFRHKNGSTVTVLCRGKVIEWNESHEPVRMVGTHTDISKLKETMASLERANEELEEFAYRTSHDLRSPLISSAKLLDIIQSNINKGDTEKASRYLTVVQESLNKLESLVTSILSIASLSHKEPTTSAINLEKLVKDCLMKFSYMDGYDSVNFQFNYEYADSFKGQLEHFRLILENLISNAIKYRDPQNTNSLVKIETSTSDNTLHIAIEDNGLGIPIKYQSQVFSMFKRFHPRAAVGTGLGLYMVKKSVGKLGGKISLESTAHATTFRMSFPLETMNTDECKAVEVER